MTRRRTTLTITLTAAVVVVLGAIAAIGAVQPPSRDAALGRAAIVGPTQATAAGDPVLAEPSDAAPETLELAAAVPATTPPTTAPPTTPPKDTAPPVTAPPTTAAPATAPPTAPPATAAPTPPPTTAPPATAPPSRAATVSSRDAACESSMLSWMNDTRAASGIAALVEDEAIQGVSAGWSSRMADRSDLAHNPDFGTQVFSIRPEATTAAENVGYASSDARTVYEEFLRSPGHHDKIIGARFHAATVGCVRDAAGWVWVTINFWG